MRPLGNRSLVSTDEGAVGLAPRPTPLPPPVARRSRGVAARELWANYRLTLVVGAVLVCLVVLPIIRMVASSFQQNPPLDTNSTTKHYSEAFAASETYSALGNTAIFALGAATLAMILGFALAWLSVRTNMPLGRIVLPITIIPLILPGVLGSIAWGFLLSPRSGLINRVLMSAFGLHSAPFNLYSLPGMIWAQGIADTPLAFLLMSAAFNLTDPSLEESASMSGASRAQVMRRVTIPLLRPAILSVYLLVFVLSMEAFDVPALIGLQARVYVYTSEIYFAFNDLPSNYGLGTALATGLLVVSVIGVLLYTRAVRQSERFATVGGKGFRTSRVDLGRLRWVGLGFVLLYMFVAVLLPLFVIVWNSFMPFVQPPTSKSLHMLSLANYRKLFSNDTFQVALKNSLILAVLTATVAMLLASLVSWLAYKTRVRGRGVLDALTMAPVAVPGIVLGVALIMLYIRSPLHIYGTIWILLIAFVTKNLPYGMRATSSSMLQIKAELQEAAEMSGATWIQTFRRVTLPLIMPGFIAGWIYVAIMSIREFGAAVILSSSGNPVLSVLAFQLNEGGLLPEAAALGVCMVGGLLVIVTIARRLTGRIGIRP
jgi:iron(III) transport system permease protein